MRRTKRPGPFSERRVFGEFALLTLFVTLVTLPVGLLIRGIGAGDSSAEDTLALMRVGGVERATASQHEKIAEQLDAVLGFPLPGLAPTSQASQPAPVQAAPAATAPHVQIIDEQPAAPVPAAAPEAITFDGRPLRKVKTVTMLVTAYSPDERSCGASADGITASGYSVWTNGMKMVAADPKVVKMGSIVTVPGYNGGRPVPVLDVGGKIKGKRLDVLYPTHEVALKWGAQKLKVDVWEYADE